MLHQKTCPLCQTRFNCPPSSKKVTCSPECSRLRKAQTHRGKSNTWSEAARRKLAASGQTPNLKKGTPAAQLSPVSGPYVTNQEAKVWSLLSPSGERYTVTNLALFIREHPALFNHEIHQAYSGLRQIQRCLNGKTMRTVSQWKGWRLLRLAV